jgi:hypothetical protein
MGDLVGFTKRLRGPHRINWSSEDIARLQAIYGLTTKQVEDVLRHEGLPLPIVLPPVTKAASDAPVRWSFTASDGRPDRVGDIVSIQGIDLDSYRANPAWFHQHDYSLPIGRSASINKVGGKLKSVLELGIAPPGSGGAEDARQQNVFCL